MYRDVRKPKLVVFHDANWKKTNSWIADVAEHMDAVIAAQRLFLNSVLEHPADCPKRWEYFPLDLERSRKYRTDLSQRRGIVVCTQWIKWKNHHKLLPQLAEVQTPFRLFGNGQEYYMLRKSGVFQRVIRRDHTTGEVFNRKMRHQFYGFVPYADVIREMGQAIASLDASVKGYTNMTHWEPLTLGTVSMIENRVVANEHNQIPDDCCYPFDLEDMGSAVDRLVSDPQGIEKLVDRADRFVQVTDCRKVVERVLRWLQKHGIVRMLGK